MHKIKIASIGEKFPVFDNFNFYDSQSLTDFDVVIINPAEVILSIPELKHIHSNVYSIQGDVVHSFLKTTKRRISEINALFRSGKMVITFLIPPTEINYQVYFEHIEGKKTTYFWLDFNGDNFLSHILAGSGKGIKLFSNGNSDSLFANYFRAFKNDLEFFAYFDVEPSYFANTGEVFLTNSTNQVVGVNINVENGLLVFLPSFLQNPDNNEKFTGVISQISKKYFGSNVVTEPPEWIKNYHIPGILELNEKISETQTQIMGLENIKIQLEEEKEKIIGFKALLYETGEILQESVVNSFRLLGFTANTIGGKNTDFDVILESDEGRAIAEVEGRENESIHKGKIDQLLSAITQDSEASGNVASGLLIGNPYRLSNLSERKDPFTPTVYDLSKQFNFALLTTVDLYNVVTYVLKHPDDEEFKKNCRETIFRSRGKLVKFPVTN